MDTDNDGNRQRETRRLLRQVGDHLLAVHARLGAIHETVGMVEVMHHPTSGLPNLNYVTPRRNTAWVSGSMVQQGITHLGKFSRVPRVHYIEGLYPPLFARTLRDLRLKLEREIPLMVYRAEGLNGQMPPTPEVTPLPEGLKLEPAREQQGNEFWWQVWRRTSAYDVLTLGVEPLYVGKDTAERANLQRDLLLMREDAPIGVVRVSIHGETAHILALGVLREARTPAVVRALQSAALKLALHEKAALVYGPGETDADRSLNRELGFLDFGSIVCYAAVEKPASPAPEEKNASTVEQPVLSF